MASANSAQVLQLLPLLFLLLLLLAEAGAGARAHQADELTVGQPGGEGACAREGACPDGAPDAAAPAHSVWTAPSGDGDGDGDDGHHDENEQLNLTSEAARRDPGQKWRFRYIEEPEAKFEVRVLEGSADQRLANLIHTLVSVRPLNFDYFTYDSGDPAEDARNMARAAGPQVSEAACARHLRLMIALLDDTQFRLALQRVEFDELEINYDERHVRLARVLDSYGHYESGMLAGKQHAPGNWDQCTSTDLLLGGIRAAGSRGPAPLERVGTSYCWARLNLDKHLDEGLARRPKGAFEAHNHTKLLVAACLPRTCHSRTFEANREPIQRLVNSQFQLPQSLFVERTLEISSLYCLVDPESEYATSRPLAGWMALGFLGAWLALVAHATLWRAGASGHWLDCFHLGQSWLDFWGTARAGATPAQQAQSKTPTTTRTTTTKQGEQPTGGLHVDLGALDAIKVLGSGFVVLGHAVVMSLTTAQDSIKGVHMAETDPFVLIMIVGSVVVDTFFVITGMLFGYAAARSAAHASESQRGPRHGAEAATTTTTSTTTARLAAKRARAFLVSWLKFPVQRLLRLSPLYFLVIWFKRSLYIAHFASWPFWDAGFNAHTVNGACARESWLTPFTPMAAYLPLSRQCLGQAWSVANDYFFALVIPPLLMLIGRKPKLTFAISIGLIFISNRAARAAYDTADPDMAHEMRDLRAHGLGYLFGGLHALYTTPHLRLGPIIIGLLAGYLVHQFASKRRGSPSSDADADAAWPRWFRGPATALSLAALAFIFFGYAFTPHARRHLAPHHLSIFANTFTTGRSIWALCNACVFARMATDWPSRTGFAGKLLAARLWRPLSRLNLALLLIHFDVLFFLATSSTSQNYFSKRDVLANFATAYSFSVPFAALLHLVFENPMNKLVRRHLAPGVFKR